MTMCRCSFLSADKSTVRSFASLLMVSGPTFITYQESTVYLEMAFQSSFKEGRLRTESILGHYPHGAIALHSTEDAPVFSGISKVICLSELSHFAYCSETYLVRAAICSFRSLWLSRQMPSSGIAGSVKFSIGIWEMGFAFFCDLDIFQVFDRSAHVPG